ncbi:MAG TPA: hypothetical protein VFR86_20330 [Burkholderiaceae bacterium]|nr:hypothetical protein [Burkholderiaceae bacterium]
MRSYQRIIVCHGVAAVILSLAACASPERIARGTPEAEVRDKVGDPVAVHVLPPNGVRRLEYVGANEQFTWMVDLDAAGRVERVRQVRTLENFRSLEFGHDNMEDVRREFGRPYAVQYYRLSGNTAWLYPYREAGAFEMMMGVIFDPKGRVLRLESGHDPRWDISE